ncbi:MAG: hypothetical protein ABL899_00155 [Nitrospira sp.]
MDKYFGYFLQEAEQIPVPRSLLPKLTEKFNTKVEFWRARGIVMIIFGTSAYCFMVAKKILAHYQDGEAPKSPQRRPSSVPRVAVRSTNYGDIPTECPIFRAALRGQMPSRGRSTPDGRLSTR